MKPFLAVGVLIVFSVPAWAHFIWLVPHGDRSSDTILMVFSDTPSPDDRVSIKKIRRTKLFARAGGKGDSVAVRMSEEKNAYKVTHEGEGVVMIAGSCRYGVVAKGKAKPFLLWYHPKTILKKDLARDRADWTFEGTAKLPLEIVPLQNKPAARVLWQGKPAAGIEVVLKVPGLNEDIERKTDSDGQFELAEPKAAGVYCMRALFVEAKSGELEGKKYEEVKHYATFAFDSPQRFVK